MKPLWDENIMTVFWQEGREALNLEEAEELVGKVG
jgi:hypothetical protein